MKFMTRLLISGQDILVTSCKYWNDRKATVWGVTSLFLFHLSRKDKLGLASSLPGWKQNNLSRRYLKISSQNEALAGNFKYELTPSHTHPHAPSYTPDTHAHRHKVHYVITYFRLDFISSEGCHWGGASCELQGKRRRNSSIQKCCLLGYITVYHGQNIVVSSNTVFSLCVCLWSL